MKKKTKDKLAAIMFYGGTLTMIGPSALWFNNLYDEDQTMQDYKSCTVDIQQTNCSTSKIVELEKEHKKIQDEPIDMTLLHIALAGGSLSVFGGLFSLSNFHRENQEAYNDKKSNEAAEKIKENKQKRKNLVQNGFKT